MIRPEKINSVSTMGAFDRYRYFIKKIADYDEFWVLKNESNNLALSEVQGKTLLPFWSAEEFIQSCLNGQWARYVPEKITLEEFEANLLPLIADRNYLIDVFPVNNKAGFVVTLDEFVHDLNNELGSYE
jgi:hypothetical protein